ncbi:MAG: MBOAT family protein, partial [Oscillospiraceae bacterium]|nr:MBOAT family protein [Oscillospiraceae bacterium]
MYFNSYIFILAFFPLLFIGYFSLCKLKAARWGILWLLLGSVVFYLAYSIPLGMVLFCSVAFNYLLYRGMLAARKTGNADSLLRIIRIVGVVANVALLFVFKYAAPFAGLLSSVFSTSFTVRILVPVGISFFTFSQISFVIDNTGEETASYSFADYCLFVLFFPKILSGPIVTAKQLIPQFHDPARKAVNFDNLSKGLFAFALGLAKKVLLADYFAIISDACFGSVAVLSGFEAVAAIFAYSLQLYFDFSGYCDMASGVSLMLNIDLPQNFNSPYQAVDITDFWKRWHITLTSFLTRYIYYPLGGNRKGKKRQYLNILIVFLVSGLWHGAGLTFIVWGLLHGLTSVLTRILKPRIKLPKLLSQLTTFLLVTIFWVFFRSNTLTQAFQMLAAPFTRAWGSINSSLSEALLQPTLYNI